MSCWTKEELENILEDVVNELDLASKMKDILMAFVELEDSGLSEPSRIHYQTQRARDLLKMY